MAITAEQRKDLIELVVLMFNASPGATLLDVLVNEYEAAGKDLLVIARGLDDLPLFKTVHRDAQTAEEFATAFLTPLALQADAGARKYIIDQFNAGLSKGDIAYNALRLLETVGPGAGAQYVAAKDILDNKTEVSLYYSVTAAVAVTDFAILQNVLAGVTNVDSTVTTAINGINDGSIGQPGGSFTLTPEANDVDGGNAADVITGVFGAGGTDATYTAGDDINGGNGNDSLNLTVTGTTASAAIIVKNVENINITDTIGGTFNSLLVEGSPIVTFKSTIAGNTSTVTNGALASTFALNGKGNLTVAYANATGTADTAKVGTTDVGTSASLRSAIDVASGNAVEKVELTTAGKNFLTIFGGTGAATLSVLGTGTNDIVIGSAKATLTVDASTSSGANTFDIGGGLSNGDVFKGGTGADTVKFAAGTAVGVVTFSGVETLTGSTSVDLTLKSDVALATLNLSAVGSGNDVVLTRSGDTSGPLTLNLGSTATTATDIAMGDLIANHVSALNINSVGTKTISVASATLDDSETVALSVTDNTAGGGLSVGWVSAGSFGAVKVTAGEEGYAYVSGIEGDAAGDVTVTAGVDGFARLNNSDIDGSVGAVNVTASSGGSADAYIYAYGDDDAPAMIASMTVTLASGAGGGGDVYAYGGSVGDVSITGGSDAYGFVSAYASALTDDGSFLEGGNIGNLTVVAGASGNVGISASTSAGSGDNTEGDGGNIGNLALTVDGDSGYGWIGAYAGSGGSVGNTTVSLDGDGASGQIDIWAYGEDGEGGNVGTVTGTLGDNTTLYLSAGGSGSVGATTITGTDDVFLDLEFYAGDGGVGALDVELEEGASVSAYAYSYGGDIGAATITTGDNSSVYSYAYTSGGSVGAVSVTTGDSSNVYIVANGEDVGPVTVVGGDGNAQVYVMGDTVGVIDLRGWEGMASVDVSTGAGGAVIYTAEDDTNVSASNGADVVTGSAGDDYFSLYAGADVATGGAGNDTIYGGSGSDAISGGTGNDMLYGESGNDTIVAGDGNDSVNGGGGNDALLGGAGNDAIDGAIGNDTITGGAGKDTMTGGTGGSGASGSLDTFVFSDVDADADTAVAGITTSTDVITDFITAVDRLDFTTAGTSANYAENTTAAANLAAALAAADTALNGTVKYYFGVVSGGAGYLVYDNDGDGVTSVIELTGVTDMAFTDIT